MRRTCELPTGGNKNSQRIEVDVATVYQWLLRAFVDILSSGYRTVDQTCILPEGLSGMGSLQIASVGSAGFPNREDQPPLHGPHYEYRAMRSSNSIILVGIVREEELVSQLKKRIHSPSPSTIEPRRRRHRPC